MKNKYAWLAGIIDGEGTITITRQWRTKSYSYRPEIHITNTSSLMLNEAVSIMEIAVGKKPKIFSTNNGNKREVYRVRFQDRNSCFNLIKLLLPHLIAKKAQAELLLIFLKGDGSNSETQAASIRKMNAGSSN